MTLVMDYDQLLSSEAPDELPDHGGTEELLIGPPRKGTWGWAPRPTFIILLGPEAGGLLVPCLLSPLPLIWSSWFSSIPSSSFQTSQP
jgi:hypothetical protein